MALALALTPSWEWVDGSIDTVYGKTPFKLIEVSFVYIPLFCLQLWDPYGGEWQQDSLRSIENLSFWSNFYYWEMKTDYNTNNETNLPLCWPQ